MYLVTKENEYEGEELLRTFGMYDDAVTFAQTVTADYVHVYRLTRNGCPDCVFTSDRNRPLRGAWLDPSIGPNPLTRFTP